MYQAKLIQSGDGLGIQVTKPLRRANIIDDRDGDLVSSSPLRVHAFDSLLLCVAIDNVADHHEADLVRALTARTETAYRTNQTTVRKNGGGWAIQVTSAEDAGFSEGDSVEIDALPQVLTVFSNNRGRAISEELRTMRESQSDDI